ncbi:MAG: GNAT family N-acetyltransferase [Candidatus Bipolaricaulota bacterium]|nr:GNAT family N-acetyltransferase [Candidatus Bipolaricaulota bacterium]
MDDAKGRMPYRVETKRLVLRCWEPRDAALLKEAIDANLDHLRPWMPWAMEEPQSVEAKAERLRVFRGEFDLDKSYVFAILSRDERLVLGSSGLHTRGGEGSLEIGYWVRSSHVRQGLGAEVAAALAKVAFEFVKVDRVEIHCHPANAASAAIPRKLGFTHEVTRRRVMRDSAGALCDSMIWTLLASEYPASPAAKIEITAYDAMGCRITKPAA